MRTDFDEFAAMLRTIMERADSGDVAEDDLEWLAKAFGQCGKHCVILRDAMRARLACDFTLAANNEKGMNRTTRPNLAKLLAFRGWTTGPLKDNR